MKKKGGRVCELPVLEGWRTWRGQELRVGGRGEQGIRAGKGSGLAARVQGGGKPRPYYIRLRLSWYEMLAHDLWWNRDGLEGGTWLRGGV